MLALNTLLLPDDARQICDKNIMFILNFQIVNKLNQN